MAKGLTPATSLPAIVVLFCRNLLVKKVIRLLDRALLVGTIDRPDVGYFAGFNEEDGG
jgi:hypothetical protein